MSSCGQTSQGACFVSDATVPVVDDCDVPRASLLKQIVFFFSSTSTRNMVNAPAVHPRATSFHLLSHNSNSRRITD